MQRIKQLDRYASIDKIFVPCESAYGDVTVKYCVFVNDAFVGMFETYTEAEHFICEHLFRGEL